MDFKERTWNAKGGKPSRKKGQFWKRRKVYENEVSRHVKRPRGRIRFSPR